MTDYTWPSVYFSYFFFTLSLGVAVFFFVRSWKRGDLRRANENVKYVVFEEECCRAATVRERSGETHAD
jgi:hypothetical protein